MNVMLISHPELRKMRSSRDSSYQLELLYCLKGRHAEACIEYQSPIGAFERCARILLDSRWRLEPDPKNIQMPAK